MHEESHRQQTNGCLALRVIYVLFTLLMNKKIMKMITKCLPEESFEKLVKVLTDRRA